MASIINNLTSNIGWHTTSAEITDERIKEIFAEQTGFAFDDNPGDGMALMDFVRAVLREAQ